MGCGGSVPDEPRDEPAHVASQSPPVEEPKPPAQPKDPEPPAKTESSNNLTVAHHGSKPNLIQMHSGHEEGDALRRRVESVELTEEEMERIRGLSNQVHLPVQNVGRLYHLFEQFADEGHNMRQRGLTKAFGAIGIDIVDKHFQKMLFDTFDNDHEGLLHFEDFVAHLAGLVQGRDEDSMLILFQIYDTDNSGFLERDEIEQLIEVQHRIAEFVFGLPPQEITKEATAREANKLLQFDENDDGKISFVEFIEMMKNRTEKDMLLSPSG